MIDLVNHHIQRSLEEKPPASEAGSQSGNYDWRTDIERLDCYHGRLAKEVAMSLLQLDGDYLLRVAKDKRDKQIKPVLSIKWNQHYYHYLIRKRFGLFYIGEQVFDSISALVNYHHRTGQPILLFKQDSPILIQPICPTPSPMPSKAMSLDSQELQSASFICISSAEKAPLVLKQLWKLVALSLFIIFLYLCIYSERTHPVPLKHYSDY